MKPFLLVLFVAIVSGCSSKSEAPAFLNDISGRYLYNADEELEVFTEDEKLYLNWRGATKIAPMKVDDGVYYIKEMNEKIQFLKNPSNGTYYISLVPKDKSKTIGFDFKKLNSNEHVPSYYLKNKDFEKALNGYKTIQQKDSKSELIEENRFNSMGYAMMREKNFEQAIEIFKLNVELHPESANVYDSLADAYNRKRDTINALENYKKSLELDSGNRRAKRYVEKHEN